MANTHIDAYQAIALVLQGGGALGSYQAGAYNALWEADIHPTWLAGISIGAINAAIIAGNPASRRMDRLQEFWDAITVEFGTPWPAAVRPPESIRTSINTLSSLHALFLGQPGFFEPKLPPPWLLLQVQGRSYYDTGPLRSTLERLIDFDRINAKEVRLSVGAVNLRTGNFTYFDNSAKKIGPEHIMASSALPPGFPPVEIEGEFYWDGGVVSNTPLQYVLDFEPRMDTLVFQIDVWSARGPVPNTLGEVIERQKDIGYSSRTRYNTDQVARMQKLRNALSRFLAKLPESLAAEPEVEELRRYSCRAIMNIIHLIYDDKAYEIFSKDYEFSRASMREHWHAGYADTAETLAHPDWLAPPARSVGIVTHDIHRYKQGRDAIRPTCQAPSAPRTMVTHDGARATPSAKIDGA
ncbi:MAG TPA: patatin-like phospholipase family protein [Alphaproteobacteria bacterium]|nr:patatin-like phospholipase family protein [Alphaproteobacteria bacterium]